MNKFEVSRVLQEIGLLLRLKTKDLFRAGAYAKAAHAIAELDADLAMLVEQKRLTEIKGVGQSLAGVIEELYKTGHSSVLEELVNHRGTRLHKAERALLNLLKQKSK
jgi:DNA polymerase (family 10)